MIKMEPPLKPTDLDCCNSGCNPCILDVYEVQMQKYKDRPFTTKDDSRKNCISQTTYTVFRLVNILRHTRDTYLFTLQYLKGCNDTDNPTEDDLALLYKPGQHLLLKGRCRHDKDNQFTRAYTPIPLYNENPLTFTVIVRLYEEGIMSKFLKNLKINSETLWRGPYGSFEVNYTFNYVLIIAQGTGIAPVFAVARDILNSECETFLKLFFCCRTEQDILLRNELYSSSSFWNFSYEVFLSSSKSVQCKYNEVVHLRRLKRDSIKAYLKDKLNSNIQVLICGSENFNKDMLEKVVACGVDARRVFTF